MQERVEPVVKDNYMLDFLEISDSIKERVSSHSFLNHGNVGFINLYFYPLP